MISFKAEYQTDVVVTSDGYIAINQKGNNGKSYCVILSGYQFDRICSEAEDLLKELSEIEGGK